MPSGAIQERAIKQGESAVDCPDCTCEFVTQGFWDCKTPDGKRDMYTADKKNCELALRKPGVNPRSRIPGGRLHSR